jgi:hypothetical protein
MPDTSHEDLDSYLEDVRGDCQKGFWRNADAYMVSLLKEYWGQAATAGNDYGFGYLPRMAPLRVDGRVVHQVWMPYHWGYTGLSRGDVVNDLIGVVADPNVFIQESKVLTCDIRPGRRPTGAALRQYVAGYRQRAGITPRTGTRILTVGEEDVRESHLEPADTPREQS